MAFYGCRSALAVMNDNFSNMLDLFFILTLVVCLSDSVRIKVKTLNYNRPNVYYLPGTSSTLTQLIFEVKGLTDGSTTGYIGLSPVKYESATYHNQSMYESSIGGNTNLKNASKSGTRFTKNETTACREGGTICIPSEFKTFWLQWKNNIIQFGRGDVVGGSVFWKVGVGHVGYDVKYVSLAGGALNDPVMWYYYDVQPLLSPDVSTYLNLKLFVPKAGDLGAFSDNDTETCMEVLPDYAGSYLFLQVFADPPVTVSIKMKSISSCETSNLFVMDTLVSYKRECLLISGVYDQVAGIFECIFRCWSTCSSVVALGFQKAAFGPQTWQICEMAEVRNKFVFKIDAT